MGTIHSPAYVDGDITQANRVTADWLNGVNTAVYSVLGDGTNNPTTAAGARTNLGVQRRNLVIMQRNAGNTAWEVLAPTGANVSVVGSTSEGLQEALNYAVTNGCGLMVFGSGVVGAAPGSYATNMITCTATITVAASTQFWLRSYGVFLGLNPGAANPGIVFESADMLDWEWGGQIGYTGGGAGAVAAIHIAPTVPNSESFTGFTSSRVRFATLAMADSAPGYNIQSTKGVGVRISVAASTAVVNNVFDIGEINGGLVGFQVDNPNAAKFFKYNTMYLPGVHQQGSTALLIGTTAGADNLIFGNKWYVALSDGVGTANALATFSENDIYDVSISNFAAGTGITLGTTALGNIFRVAKNDASTPVTDNSTVKTSVGMYGDQRGQAVNTLSADVDVNNTGNFFTGPTVAQGTAGGVWFASGQVTVRDVAGAAAFTVKLWDGTTVIASAVVNTTAINLYETVHLSGYITTPAGNIRISVKDATSTSGKIIFNASGESKDSSLTVFRIS